jgi:hypothetical protein
MEIDGEAHLPDARAFQRSLVALAHQFIDGAVKPRAHDAKKTKLLFDAAMSERALMRGRMQARHDLYTKAIFVPRSAAESAVRAFEAEARARKAEWEATGTRAAMDAWLSFADERPVVEAAVQTDGERVPPVYTKFLA